MVKHTGDFIVTLNTQWHIVHATKINVLSVFKREHFLSTHVFHRSRTLFKLFHTRVDLVHVHKLTLAPSRSQTKPLLQWWFDMITKHNLCTHGHCWRGYLHGGLQWPTSAHPCPCRHSNAPPSPQTHSPLDNPVAESIHLQASNRLASPQTDSYLAWVCGAPTTIQHLCHPPTIPLYMIT